LVDVEDGAVTAVEGIVNPYLNGHTPGDIPVFIQQQNAQGMLSGGMGGRAIQFFEQMGIHAATGAQGTVRHSLERYFGGDLKEAAPCAESVAHGHG
jgi:predicted Fe-Mo cluster-binding NifX family protein